MRRRWPPDRSWRTMSLAEGSRSGATLDAETALVFGLAPARSDTRRPPEIRGITDWQRLLRLASDENALIALRDFLRTAETETIPVAVNRQLAILSLDREFHMRRLRERVEQVLIALNGAEIDVLLLKGGALAATVYGSFDARLMRDIDLLVRPEEAGRVRTLMRSLGWADDPELPGDASYNSHHHLPPLRDPKASGLRLEIHRSVLPAGHPFRFTEDEIWQSARRIHVGAGHALVMHPAHHAVHIAIHFAWSHMMKSGAWNAFRDLDALRTAHVLDWSRFTAIATRWGASSCSYWTLKLASDLSGLVVPEHVTRALRPRGFELMRRPLARHFLNVLTRRPACPSVRLNQLLWYLAMRPLRDGHGNVRPWLVSRDLLLTFQERTLENHLARSASRLSQMRRSGRYIAGILT